MRIVFVLVAGLAASLAAPFAGPAEARPRRAVQQSPVVVDVSPLRARGLTVEADIVQATIAQEIARTGPYRGRVLVRITGLSLNAFAGSTSFSGRGLSSGGPSFDYLEGDFQVVGPNGEVLAGQPLLVNAPASSGGAYYLPGVDRRRIETIARNFVGWIRQYSG